MNTTYPAVTFPPTVDPPIVQSANFTDDKSYRARTDGQIRTLQALVATLLAGTAFPLGTTDTAGGALVIGAGQASWNRSASASVQNVYALPADVASVVHTVGWQSGVAPKVTAPAGWVILNPSSGGMTVPGGSYLYGSGGAPTGESWDWVADVVDQIYWARS